MKVYQDARDERKLKNKSRFHQKMVAKNVKRLRTSLGITQLELSVGCGISRVSCNRVETEDFYTKPNLETISRIATYFNVNIQELFKNRRDWSQ